MSLYIIFTYFLYTNVFNFDLIYDIYFLFFCFSINKGMYIFVLLFFFLINKGIQTSSNIRLFPWTCAVPPSHTHWIITGRNPLEVALRCGKRFQTQDLMYILRPYESLSQLLEVTYDIFLCKQKYLHQISLYIFTKKKALTCLKIYKSI